MLSSRLKEKAREEDHVMTTVLFKEWLDVSNEYVLKKKIM
jgi:hypothetical protein